MSAHRKSKLPVNRASIDSMIDSISADEDIIEICEQRLALSASLIGSCLANWLDPQTIQAVPAVTFDTAVEGAVYGPIQEIPQADANVELTALMPAIASGNVSLLDQAAAWGNRGIDGRGQTIAVIDTGIAYDHVAFGGGFGPGYRVVGGYDFAENDNDPYDDGPSGYHGTHVAGLAAGLSTLAGSAFRGIAPGADLVALRVFNDFGQSSLAWIESALRWVHDHQADFESPITAVNLSLGTELNDGNRDYAMGVLEDELRDLYDDNILVFAATGNNFAKPAPADPTTDATLYPSSSSYVSGVGSIDVGGNLSSFSQRENEIFAAPGERLRGPVPEHVYGDDGDHNDFSFLSGTSMASPQLAAASTLVRQAMLDAGLNPTGDAILDRLRDTSDIRIDPQTGVSYQTLNLDAALNFPAATTPPATNPVLDQYIGTNQNDALTLDLRGALRLSDGSTDFALRVAGPVNGVDTPFVIDGAGGGDTLQIYGSSGSESIILRPGSDTLPSRLLFSGGEIEIRGFENVVFIGGGGEDRATLYDSDRDDTLQSFGGNATLSGIGFEFRVEQITNLFAHATAGGHDTAHLHDTAGDDRLAIRPQFSSLRSDTTSQVVFGFERVFAYSDSGGYDTADLSDSVGDDLMTISKDRALISGPGYRAFAYGFDDVSATASRGGQDTVRIYVDDPGGTWYSNDSLTQWLGKDGVKRIARGFEVSETFERFATAASPQAHVSALHQVFEELT